MAERRRPLDNDDGQGSLFGGDTLASARPTAPWQRPAREEESSAAPAPRSPEFEAGVSTATAEASPAAGGRASVGSATADASPAVEFDAGMGSATHDARPATGRGAGVDAATADAPPGAEFEIGASAVAAPPTEVPSHAELVAGEELVALERATVGVDGLRSPRAPLAGPTLDDVMSRAWEGLATGLPAACPLCDGEVVPALSGPPQGRCNSCGTTIE